jgi:tellurite methyltransferase
MGEQREEGREEAERHVPGEIAAAHAQDRGGDEARNADADRRHERLSQEGILSDQPSAFVVTWLPRVADLLRASGVGIAVERANTIGGVAPAALDVAMGRGRHTLLLARAGFRTFGVDHNEDAVRAAVAMAAAEGLDVRGWCADLTSIHLPARRFDLVLVTRYLQRDLFPALREAVRPGGFVVYETFTVRQRLLGFGPTSPGHLLAPGELREQFGEWDIVFYEEIEKPAAVAQVVARAPAIGSRTAARVTPSAG